MRVALEVTREAGGSTFVQRIRLTEGGDRVEIEHLVDWRTPDTLLKAAFPLTATNPKATYDLGLGTIERGQQRAEPLRGPRPAVGRPHGRERPFGVAVMNDCKYGWDKPADNTLRLTLMHTPHAERRAVRLPEQQRPRATTTSRTPSPVTRATGARAAYRRAAPR